GGKRTPELRAAGSSKGWYARLLARYGLHEPQVAYPEVLEIRERVVDVGGGHAEPRGERAADLIGRRRRQPRAVAAGVVRPLRYQRRERPVHPVALDRAAENEMVRAVGVV